MTSLVKNLLFVLARRGERRIQWSPFYRRFRPRIDVAMIDGRTVISHAFRYAYFRVPKAANSTIVASLLFSETGTRISDLNELQVIKDRRWPHASDLTARQLRALLKTYFKFTFVRDPYTRVLAAFLDKIQRNENEKRNAVNKFLGRPNGADVSFEQFLAYLENGGIDHNAHWARQVDLIPVPILALDFIGKMESLSLDLPHVLTRIFGRRIDACSVTSHSTQATRGHAYWTPDLRGRVYKIYEPDFAAFGYQRGGEY